LTYACGRTPKNEIANPKVRLLVKPNRETPSEVTSGVNQKLRSMPDVEVIYARDEADIVLNLLGFENTTQQTNQLIGYAVSVVTVSPCKGNVGKDSFDFGMILNNYIFSGPRNPERMISDIVSSVDATD